MGPTRYTLLTGATGLLGQVLLVDLLRARLPVAVLVRASRDLTALERIDFQLRRFEAISGRQLPRPVVLTGELTVPALGLSSADRDFLAQHCERVLHSAACVSFKPAASHPRQEPFTTNIDGTRRLAELCGELGIREFHHISSAFSCGIREGLVLETEGNVGQHFSNDYESSKRSGEELLQSNGRLSDLTIYRPSIVIDPTPGALPMGDRTIYLAFSVYQLISKRLGLTAPIHLLRQLGLSGQERKNIVPVAWVSRVIVQILRRPSLHGKTYHLTHSTGTSLLEMMTAFHQILQDQGYPPLERDFTESDFGELTGVVDQYLETFAPYFRDDPRFDQSELNRALQACSEPVCPDVSDQVFRDIACHQLVRRHDLSAVQTAPLSVWSKFQLQNENATVEELAPLRPVSNLVRYGLLLSGSAGGDWSLTIDEFGEVRCLPGGAETADYTYYMAAQTWEQLLQNQISLATACHQGRVLIESLVTSATECEAEEQFERLMEAVSEQISSAGWAGKVSLHGK